MIRSSDQRSFQVYLILLGQSAVTGALPLRIDLETIGKVLKLPEDWKRSRTRRQILKILRKLEETYYLIHTDFDYGDNPHIQLKKFTGNGVMISSWILEPATLILETPPVIFLQMAREVLKKEGSDLDH